MVLRIILVDVVDVFYLFRNSFDNLDLLKDGIPGALVTALVLGVHELGHILVANSVGVKLGVPYFVPSWQVMILIISLLICGYLCWHVELLMSSFGGR